MGFLRNLLEKFKAKSEREKEAMEDVYLQKRIMERQKNANERELERYMEERRQKYIEARLKRVRKQKAKEIWTTNNFTHNPNLFRRRYY